jgi:hypothetical protein
MNDDAVAWAKGPGFYKLSESGSELGPGTGPVHLPHVDEDHTADDRPSTDAYLRNLDS